MSEYQKLKKLFYNPKQGLNSVDKIKIKAEENEIDLKPQDIEEFYNKQPITQIMKPIRKPPAFSSYVANYPGHIYQMDIIVYQKYKYHNYQYILVIIDIYSRFANARAMTNRTLPTIINKFEEMIEEMGAPFKLQSDNEFNKSEFIKVLKKYDIKARFSDPDEKNKNPIVERVNATIETLLQKLRILFKRADWYNLLQDVLYNYNNTTHSTIKNKPIDVFKGNKANEQDIVKVDYKFNPGDKVKLVKKNNFFDKIDVIKLSKKTYVVESVKGERIKLYGVDDKTYKPYELSKVHIFDQDDELQFDITQPTQEYKDYRKKLKYDKIDIDESNIINTKREKRQNPKYV